MLHVLLLASSYTQPLGRPLITRSAVTQRTAQFLMQDGDEPASDASSLPEPVTNLLSELELSDPTTLPKPQQDEVAGAAAIGALVIFLLPLVDNVFTDLLVSSLVGAAPLAYLSLRQDDLGGYARQVGGVAVTAAEKVGEVDAQLGVSKAVSEKAEEILPEGFTTDLSYDDVKKYGTAGVVAYILTELAFWAIAFPVAAATLFFTAGHWPDLGDGADRAAVLGFVFAGANVARLAVPLRFGVAFAAAPWCDENIVKPVQAKFGGGD